MEPPSLTTVPPEIFLEILSFLDAKTLLLCASVCKLWHETVKNSVELQYTVELWVDGMVRGSSGLLTCAETLEVLYRHRRAWKNMEWTSKIVVEIESLVSCQAYELVAGVFAQKQRGQDFLAISLPHIAEDPDNATTASDLGINSEDFQDFAMDPTQDLFVFLHVPPGGCGYLELRTISSQQPHPCASQLSLTLDLDRDPEMSLSIQIVDDIIGMFFWDPIGLLVFNWRAGTTIADVAGSTSLEDFHFLSPRSYILAHEGDDVDQAGRIEIFTFDGDRTNSPIHVATLQLPELHPNFRVTSMTIQAGPFCAKEISGTPFSKSNDNRIYMILIQYDNRYWYRLFVHHRWLHQYVSNYVRENPKLPTVVPWDEWGPQNSRLLSGQDRRWIRHVHGERVALAHENPQFVEILDFGIIPRRADAATELPSSTAVATQVHLHPSATGMDDVFLNVVTTSLPYTSTLRSLDEEHDLFLIDQDRIIGLSTSESVPSHQMTVYMF